MARPVRVPPRGSQDVDSEHHGSSTYRHRLQLGQPRPFQVGGCQKYSDLHLRPIWLHHWHRHLPPENHRELHQRGAFLARRRRRVDRSHRATVILRT